jgi:hypothetical protein
MVDVEYENLVVIVHANKITNLPEGFDGYSVDFSLKVRGKTYLPALQTFFQR